MLFLGVPYAVGYEIDPKYTVLAYDAIEEKLDQPCFDIIQADIAQQPITSRPIFDLVITNPPFGTK